MFKTAIFGYFLEGIDVRIYVSHNSVQLTPVNDSEEYGKMVPGTIFQPYVYTGRKPAPASLTLDFAVVSNSIFTSFANLPTKSFIDRNKPLIAAGGHI